MTEVEVTLVIPVLNEEGTLAALLRSVERQSYQPAEIVFVDGGSADETVPLLLAWCDARHPTGRLIEAGDATPGRGRNVGIESATSDWVALTDAGIELDAHWLERLVRRATAQADIDIVYGHYEPAAGTRFATSAALAYVESPRPMAYGPMRSGCIASCLMKRSLWERAGGFPDLRAAEDRVFMGRVDELGARKAIAPEAVVHWQLQPDLRSTFRRFRIYSKVNVDIGEQRNWHYGVGRMYLAATPFALLAAVLRQPRWLSVPLAGALARVARSVWKGREGRGLLWAANPARFVTVGVILLTVDLATFAGWVDAIVDRRRAG